MNSVSTARLLAVGVLLLPMAARGAVVVDWLGLADGGSASGFALLDDGGSPVATGSLVPDPGAGIVFVGYPSARTLNANFWAVAPEVSDSGSGDATVGAVAFRVVPQSGSAAYTIDLHLPAGPSFVLAIGGMLRNSSGATVGVEVQAIASSGGLGFSGTSAWDNGITALTQPLAWDGSTLSTLAGSDGDSRVAFFQVGPLTGADPVVRLRVANGYALGTGDEITVAVGRVVPEPASMMAVLLGCGAWLGRRRRDGGRG